MFGKRKAFNFSNMTHLGRLLLLMIIVVSSSSAHTQSGEENFLDITFYQDVTVCELEHVRDLNVQVACCNYAWTPGAEVPRKVEGAVEHEIHLFH